MIDTRIDIEGYVTFRKLDRKKSKIMEHIVVAERELCRPLEGDEVVHHINEIRTDNRWVNLMVLPRRNHLQLHRYLRAKQEGGFSFYLKCPLCKEYDHPENMYIKKGGLGYHRECQNEYQRNRYHKSKVEF